MDEGVSEDEEDQELYMGTIGAITSVLGLSGRAQEVANWLVIDQRVLQCIDIVRHPITSNCIERCRCNRYVLSKQTLSVLPRLPGNPDFELVRKTIRSGIRVASSAMDDREDISRSVHQKTNGGNLSPNGRKAIPGAPSQCLKHTH